MSELHDHVKDKPRNGKSNMVFRRILVPAAISLRGIDGIITFRRGGRHSSKDAEQERKAGNIILFVVDDLPLWVSRPAIGKRYEQMAELSETCN